MHNDSILWNDSLPGNRGFDPNYIVLSKLEFQIDTLSYRGDGSLSAGLRGLSLVERCGFQLDNLSGALKMNNDRLVLNEWALKTPSSHLNLSAALDWAALKEGRGGQANFIADAIFSSQDIKLLAGQFVDDDFLSLWPSSPLQLKVGLTGNVDRLLVDTLGINWSDILDMNMSGDLLKPLSDLRSGQMLFNLRTHKMEEVKATLSKLTDGAFAMPANWSLSGKSQIHDGYYSVDLQSILDGGHLDIAGGLDLENERYDAKIVSNRFPMKDFVPTLYLGKLSAKVNASGRGFDLLKKSTHFKAKVIVDTLQFNQWNLGKMSFEANVADGKGLVNFASANDVLEGEGSVETTIEDDMQLKLRSELPGINLQNIMGLKYTLLLGASFDIDAYTNKNFTAYGIGGGLQNIRFITDEKGIPAKDLLFNFETSEDTTRMWTSAGDLEMHMAASNGIESVISQALDFVTTLQQQLVNRKLNHEALKNVAPLFDLHLKAGNSNPLGNVLRNMGYTYRTMALNLSSAPHSGVNGNFRLGGLSTGGLLLDTVNVDLLQDSTGLIANGWVKNYNKRNPNKFEAKLKSYLMDSGAGVDLIFYDKKGVKSIDLGVRADLEDKAIRVKFYPEHPVIAYRNFTVNKNNYVRLGTNSSVSADVDLLADDGTGLRIYGEPVDSTNDVTVSLNRVNLAELSDVLPYLPKLGGLFSGDFHIVGGVNNLSAMATANVEKFNFDGAALGNIGLEAMYLPKEGGEHYANAYISSEGKEVLAVDGTYSTDGEGKFAGVANLLDFPMELLNGFLVGTDVAMSGNSRGSLTLDGEMSNPQINGEVTFDKAHLYSDVYGIDFRLDEAPVRFVGNQLILNNYALHSKQSNNPLLLNGSLDMRDFSNIKMDFTMLAKNFELINTKKKAQSLVFGKVYADFSGSLRGSLDDMYVRGRLDILNRTDVTYILKDSPLTVDDRLHDLVQFVSFDDPVEVVEKIVPTSNFDMTMVIGISDAAVFHCNLSEDGENYVDLEGGGDLTLRLTQQGDMRLTGRFTANRGEMKYSLPVIPLKTFKLAAGSYVDFTGDVENPTLNIVAKERVKATVTENDQPRSVAFDVGVSITQPLERMGLEFTIEAPEDLAVQNQLTSMTKAERGKTAVAMLATGMYLTDESLSSGGTGFKASNALTAFLQSEIQNIAGNALKTIDLSIGMENNTTSTGSTTTDYSFQFAKRFWGNRISVIVGGKVSTGAEAENSAESFIDNIAVEYRLDKTASRYVRVFYDRGVQDPLEGQLTKTGAGLVLRKKSNRLGDLFIFRTRKSKKDKIEK